MKQTLKLAILLIALISIALSCEENEKFSTSSALKLEFSADTLRFDTVFTAIASPVQRMKVHNRNNNSISFESIELMNPEESGFRINVDGQSGTLFQRIDLLRKDSIYIVIDTKPNARNGKNALMRDSIRLTWNGNTKYVQLGAYAVDVDIWDNKVITTNTTLTSNKGYYIRGTVKVDEGVTLSIEEGTTLYFDQAGFLDIAGNIVARGTANKRITLRGHRFDRIERNVPYDNASGQWLGIQIQEKSFENIFENINIRNSHIGLNFLPSTPQRKKATMINTIVHNTSEYGIKATNCNIDAVNCQFSNSAGSLLTLIGGSYSFLHCTIANYYQWHSRTAAAVVLVENTGKETFPFEKCHFANSIITGTFRDDLDLLTAQDEGTKILFSNCLIQAKVLSADPRFVDTKWNIDPMFPFMDLNSLRRYDYRFELTNNSSAKNIANVEHAQKAPTDLRGISRFADSKPDIGCYEWTTPAR